MTQYYKSLDISSDIEDKFLTNEEVTIWRDTLTCKDEHLATPNYMVKTNLLVILLIPEYS